MITTTEARETPLSTKMKNLARSGHPRSAELLEAANQLESCVDGPTRVLLGAWAKARRIWSECSGEPLV